MPININHEAKKTQTKSLKATTNINIDKTKPQNKKDSLPISHTYKNISSSLM
jgi:hypothetical protein